ncbi:MAG: response regulator [Deltaproteobacteria bacterium]|nr:response regulator [Deltaproteobacteria bacterium]
MQKDRDDLLGNEYSILISDRNPNIRKLLQRELIADGYRVFQARNGNEVIRFIRNMDNLDLLVLDSDLSDISFSSLQTAVQEKMPGLPVILHGYNEPNNFPKKSINSVFIEKGSNSIEQVKRTALGLIRKTSE